MSSKSLFKVCQIALKSKRSEAFYSENGTLQSKKYVRDQRAIAFTYLINIEFTTDIVKACVQVIEEIYDLKKEKIRKGFGCLFLAVQKMDWKAASVAIPLGGCFGLRVR